MPPTHGSFLAAIAIALVLVAAAGAQQKHVPAEIARLIELLELGPTSVVADLGAGSGEVTFELARQLGPKARVYSTDIAPDTVTELRARAAELKAANVIVREGKADETNLPDACCDAVIVRHVYHHFGNPAAMNASILRTLKAGAFFAVMDFPPEAATSTFVPPARRGSGPTHGVTSKTVVAELEAAGFEILEVLPEWPGGLFLVLARRPQ